MGDPDVFALPSYESARLPDAWPFITPYLSRHDLISLSLVSKKLQGVAQGSLWSEPRKHWTQQDVSIVDQLHSLMDALTISQRSKFRPHLYVQTLDLSYLESDSLTYTFSGGWASRLLSQLPNLRSFMVSHTDAFDHSSITTNSTKYEQLRLLSIISCPNLTYQALRTLLRSAMNLYYLEISQCPRTRNLHVIQAISDLSKLGVLKLAESAYSDEDILSLARSVISSRADPNNPLPQNICSLDVRGNNLSDAIVDSLKFLGEALPAADEPPPYDADNLDDLESSVLISSPDHGWSTFFEARLEQDHDKTKFSDSRTDVVRQVRSQAFRSPVEVGNLGEGLTHLYLSGNNLSTSAIITFLQNLPLEKLDCGDLNSLQRTARADANGVPDIISAARSILDAVTDCPSLKQLRVSHQIITGFVDCDPAETTKVNGGDEPPPYPYSWHRYQGTQWDPTIMTGAPVKMLQFSPAILALDSLTLTAVPQTTSFKGFISCLTSFLEAAGDMQRMAKQYQERKNDGKNRLDSSRHLSGSLREIRIEISSVEDAKDKYDGDTEAYEDASQADFSFFPDEKDAYVSTARLQKTSTRDSAKAAEPPTSLDVAAELTAYRLQKRKEMSQDQGGSENAQSVWNGKLSLFRNPKP